MSAFALLIPPANLPVHLQRLTERSSTMRVLPQTLSPGSEVSPTLTRLIVRARLVAAFAVNKLPERV